LTERLLRHIDDGTTDLADDVMRVSADRFTDQATAARERKRVFERLPMVVGHASQLTRAYDYLTGELAGAKFIVSRQDDGSLRALLNICRHRGAPLTTQCTGRARVFACPYHGWSYKPDGSLLSVPDAQTFGDLEPNLGLVALPVEQRHGLIWVIVDPDARIDVAGWLGPMDEVLQGYGLEHYYQFRVADVEVPCNWKVLVDAFVDGYHVKFLHKKSAAPYFHSNRQTFDQLGQHARFLSPRKSIEKLGDSSSPVESYITTGHFLMPNVTVLRQPTHFEMLSFRPHRSDPGRCTMTFRLIVPERPSTDEDELIWEKNWDILMKVVKDEDLPLNKLLQESAQSAHAPSLIFGRNEVANQLFHRQLDELLAEEAS
jgi:phenylpropionate dioxygenase-like ring-hydroxylating dioxygenase large terminal subunit